jgi:hypothetical protein
VIVVKSKISVSAINATELCYAVQCVDLRGGKTQYK